MDMGSGSLKAVSMMFQRANDGLQATQSIELNWKPESCWTNLINEANLQQVAANCLNWGLLYHLKLIYRYDGTKK